MKNIFKGYGPILVDFQTPKSVQGGTTYSDIPPVRHWPLIVGIATLNFLSNVPSFRQFLPPMVGITVFFSFFKHPAFPTIPLKETYYAQFLLVDMFPGCLNGMLVTCFGKKNRRIEHSLVLYTAVSQP